MRQDLHKLLVDRPRRGGGYARKGRHQDYDDMPSKEGMKRPYGYNTKNQTDNLVPLFRFLDKQVGRPWNKVFSELSTLADRKRNAVKGHILQHLFQYGGVQKDTYQNGKQRFQNVASFYRGNSEPVELRNGDLYIDDFGILRKYKRKVVKKKSYRQLEEERWMLTARHLPDGQHARKINGVWYLVVLCPIKGKDIFTSTYTTARGTSYNRSYVTVNDIFGTSGEPKNFIEKYGSLVFAAAKKAMNSKELRQYGLQND